MDENNNVKRGRGRPKKVIDEEDTKRGRGRPRKNPLSIYGSCSCCGKDITDINTWVSSNSDLYINNEQHITVCKECLDRKYKEYTELYSKKPFNYQNSTIEGNVERYVIERICMMFDIYYSDFIFDIAYKQKDKIPILSAYMRTANLNQFKGNTYTTTLIEKQKAINEGKGKIAEVISDETIKFFGTGFEDEDYIFLQNEYADWTSRHECKTKAQEEIIKDICYNRLTNLKAQRKGADTKDITATFNKLMESGKLQPKQNDMDSISDTQTFGTLIDKWENTKPIPEIDPDLKDVDKIGLYLDVFFKGHLAKMMGMKNGLSRLYDKFIKKYTVEKPEYADESDAEAMFDAVFGNTSEMED